MITELQAINFKSWKDTTKLKLAPLTGFFGTNSSGKSSIIQLLLMLKQTTESSDRSRVLHTGDDKSLVDLGTFYDLIHGHKTGVSLDISLSWDFSFRYLLISPESKTAYSARSNYVSFNTTIGNYDERPIVKQFYYSFSDQNNINIKFGMERKSNFEKKNQYDLISENFIAKRNPGRPWSLPSPFKSYDFPDELTGYYQNLSFFSDFVLAFEKLFQSMIYLGPLREYPKRSYLWAGEKPYDIGSKGENSISALLSSRSMGKTFSPGYKKHKQTVEQRIAYWLREMGMIDSFTLKPIAQNRKDYELRVKKTAKSPEVLITDVGFGVSQILPVLVLCYYIPEGSILILEQPEIHLHPSVQACLADVFIEAVTRRNIQIILESHSEHLLRRLQRRIAEEKISADKTALYFCRMENAASAIEKLEINQYGDISNWPKDFFGDDLGELARMVEAKMDRIQRGETNS